MHLLRFPWEMVLNVSFGMTGGFTKGHQSFSFRSSIATRKTRTVQNKLQGRNWMKSLFRISTLAQIDQFVSLWECLSEVALQPWPDTITWQWTASGVHSAAATYRCQFAGTHTPFKAAKIWRAHVEPKCRFFAWLYTARSSRPHDPICKLCHIHPETVQYLLLDCSFTSFTTTVRELIFGWNGSIGIAPPTLGSDIN